jgi:RND family efflux transporter MFP subunit
MVIRKTTVAFPRHGSVMERRSPPCIDAGQKASTRILRHLSAALAVALLAAALSACNDRSATPVTRAAFVRTEIVQPRDRQASVTLTGEVQARFRADLSFLVSGRVIERFVDVGFHVEPGQVLARIDPAEQQADVDAATAAVIAAESQLRVARATFERQKTLIEKGYTTRVAFDNAQEGLRVAEGSLETAKARLGRAKDALGDTELRARAAGVITARSIEVGQVVDAAQRAFTLAQDGERDAVFDVDESAFFGDFESGQVSLTLVSDPNVTAVGQVREVSPVLDPKSSTVRVKVAIQNPPAGMTLGSAVAGTAKRKPVSQIALPWTALAAIGSKPAVWIVDPATDTASLKPVSISDYEAGAMWISGGLEPGERVVVDGCKLLSPGQRVTYEEGR